MVLKRGRPLTLVRTYRLEPDITEGTTMLRCTETVLIAALTAMLLALCEPVLAASDAGKILFICILIALFRSPLWVANYAGGGRQGRI